MTTEDHEYRRRMDNWRRWRISERRSLGGSPYPVYNLTPRPPRGENIMPLLVGEAEETDQAVQALPAHLRRAVEIWYLREGSINQKRKMLGCRRERMLEMVEEARAKLSEWIAGNPRKQNDEKRRPPSGGEAGCAKAIEELPPRRGKRCE